ncbi:hypothetical protein V2J09_018858 [Rumex salicifolius]
MDLEFYWASNFFHEVILLIFWLSIWEDVAGQESVPELYHSSKSKIAHSPTSGLFGPIEISPSVLPHYPVPEEPVFPPFPTIPTRYNPVLTGKCPVNFTAISDIFDKTASDCAPSIASILGNAICCPQFSSLLHIFQGYYKSADQLVLPESVAEDCFTDIVNILASRGANSTVDTICSFKSSILMGSSCPVKSLSSFEKVLNTSQLLEACTAVDQLKECCSPVCQSAISEAALQLSGGELAIGGSKTVVEGAGSVNALSDCKGVVYSWLARMLPLDAANSVFRVLSSCKLNKVCPLSFGHQTEVAKACHNVAAPSPSCCSSLNAYIGQLNTQMLLTNRQAIICATTLASMLQEADVMTNVYDLCDVDLRDFSLQGCLLQSMPVDIVFDNVTGYSFMCDFSDNTGAPWPLSSSMSSFSLCAEKSLPAQPTKQNSGHAETCHDGIKLLALMFSLLAIMDALVH